jgi:hypothetical protein
LNLVVSASSTWLKSYLQTTRSWANGGQKLILRLLKTKT